MVERVAARFGAELVREGETDRARWRAWCSPTRRPSAGWSIFFHQRSRRPSPIGRLRRNKARGRRRSWQPRCPCCSRPACRMSSPTCCSYPAPDALRRQRSEAKITDSEFSRRARLQMTDDEKAQRSDFVFDNTGSRRHMKEFVAERTPTSSRPTRRRRLTRSDEARGARRPRLAAVVAGGLFVLDRLMPSWYAARLPGWYARRVYPLADAADIRAAATKYRLDPALVAAISTKRAASARTPSRTAVLWASCRCCRPPPRRSPARQGRAVRARDLSDPRINILYGSNYVRYLLDQLPRLAGDGGGGLQRWVAAVEGWAARTQHSGVAFTLADVAFAETRDYVRDVQRCSDLPSSLRQGAGPGTLKHSCEHVFVLLECLRAVDEERNQA